MCPNKSIAHSESKLQAGYSDNIDDQTGEPDDDFQWSRAGRSISSGDGMPLNLPVQVLRSFALPAHGHRGFDSLYPTLPPPPPIGNEGAAWPPAFVTAPPAVSPTLPVIDFPTAPSAQ